MSIDVTIFCLFFRIHIEKLYLQDFYLKIEPMKVHTRKKCFIFLPLLKEIKLLIKNHSSEISVFEVSVFPNFCNGW